MSDLLQQAFAAAAKLSAAEQDVLAARVLAELNAENAFDQAGLRPSLPSFDVISSQ
jgi:hypothetical protein